MLRDGVASSVVNSSSSSSGSSSMHGEVSMVSTQPRAKFGF